MQYCTFQRGLSGAGEFSPILLPLHRGARQNANQIFLPHPEWPTGNYIYRDEVESIVADCTWEYDLMWDMTKFFREEDVALDLGCNVGAWTLFFAKLVGPNGRVFCFDLQEWVFQCIYKTAEQNNLSNIRPKMCGVSNKSGTATIRTNHAGGSHICKDGDREVMEGWDLIDVPVVTVDECEFENVSIIKMDVEGQDVEVLEGALKTIEKWRPIMVVETREGGLEPATEMLTPLNYTPRQAKGDNYIWYPEEKLEDEWKWATGEEPRAPWHRDPTWR